MEEIIKHINDTNASYRALNAGDAKNTDLFLDNEHYEMFKDAGEQITVRFSKENLQKAILFIASILPRKYDNSSVHKIIPFSEVFVLDQLAFLDGFFTQDDILVETRTQVWNARKDVPQKNGEIDRRFYFNGLLEDVSYKSHTGEIKNAKFTIRNYVAGGYSDLHIKKANDGVFDVWITNVLEPYNDRKEEGREQIDVSRQSLQQIFYGAPGTGKSNTIKNSTEQAEKEGRVFRTTFHPDSDYSTFVGCYKPGMKSADRIYSAEELAVKLKEIKNSGVTYPCHKFAAQYWRSLKDLSADTIKQILVACGFTESMNVEVSKGVAIGQEYLDKEEDGKIIYTFTPQAFTNAYVKAWNTEEEVYLIIEEINRGNCAQIFGDLFQLLDRKNGVSEYPIDADADLANYLSKKLASSTHKDITDEIREGKKLKLPSNLYIWATMNTSDQSLFPIDSAFKRRWEWKYIPIKEHPDKKYKIEIGEKTYDWWGFLERINKVIGETTSSEDKKLGYFFVKTETSKVSDEQFVGKVLFYIWNDVFKNYGFDHTIFSKGDKDKFVFSDFFNADGTPNKDSVQQFLKRLEETIKIDRPLDVTPNEEPTTVSEEATESEA